jgi:hypothetical protein
MTSNHPSPQPTPYSNRQRLRDQITDAREALAAGDATILKDGTAAYSGRLEPLLKMVCDSAAAILDDLDAWDEPGLEQFSGGWVGSGSAQ